MHMDASVFPDPFEFKPERWLGEYDPKMDRSFVPFTKGSRSCLGIKYVFRNFRPCSPSFTKSCWQIESDSTRTVSPGRRCISLRQHCLDQMVPGWHSTKRKSLILRLCGIISWDSRRQGQGVSGLWFCKGLWLLYLVPTLNHLHAFPRGVVYLLLLIGTSETEIRNHVIQKTS